MGIAIILIFFVLIIVLFHSSQSKQKKEFEPLIKAKLKRHGLSLVKLKTPSFFDKGPFKKLTFETPKINLIQSSIPLEKTYYRIIFA